MSPAGPRFIGKVALVTGGLSGIGQAVANRLLAEGARVVAADISAASRPLQDDALTPAHLDVADSDSVTALLAAIDAAYGRLDMLVNCAGIGSDVPFLDTSAELFDRIISVNLRGTFLVGQAAARLMARDGGGSIVNVASVSGVRGNIGRAAYGASKGGVINLSQVMAVELAADSIRVNVLAPGPIDTPLVAAMHDPAIREAWLRVTPMRRYGSPNEVASAAAFLCSDDASFMTGHILAVDGGLLSSSLTAR